MHGAYEALDGGLIYEALEDLTGWPAGRVLVSHLHSSSRDSPALLPSRARGILLQAASGMEEPQGGVLDGSHGYSILESNRNMAGNVMTRLKNPWAGHKWTCACNAKDTRWTPEMKADFATPPENEEDDGTFWMHLEDFVKSFTHITYIDLLPNSFSIMRAESEWTNLTSGGCANRLTWSKNPQLILKVLQPTYLIISLSQPDTRMMVHMGVHCVMCLFVLLVV